MDLKYKSYVEFVYILGQQQKRLNVSEVFGLNQWLPFINICNTRERPDFSKGSKDHVWYFRLVEFQNAMR